MLDADPVFIGAVYTEADRGSDTTGDTFEVSFEGGAADTQLTRLILNGDQTSRSSNNPGLDEGDVVFDTEDGGIGADDSFGFSLVSIVTQDGSTRPGASVEATVVDGSSLLVLDLENFHAGDKLTFSIDVDELVFWEPGTTTIDEINDGLDPLTSGLEFQRSTMEATFNAPFFETATASFSSPFYLSFSLRPSSPTCFPRSMRAVAWSRLSAPHQGILTSRARWLPRRSPSLRVFFRPSSRSSRARKRSVV